MRDRADGGTTEGGCARRGRGTKGAPAARRLAAALAGVWLAASAAGATPVIGDATTIALTGGFLGSLGAVTDGIDKDALGRLVIPVVGGDVEIPLLTGTVLHSGSITLSQGAASLELADFVIDLTDPGVSGMLTYRDGGNTLFSGSVALFEGRLCVLSTGTDPCLDTDGSTLLNGVGLGVAGALATFLDDAFGIAGAAGETFGVALLDLRFAVPEPAVALLLAAAALAGAARSRRTL